jgi:hypothetical protein
MYDSLIALALHASFAEKNHIRQATLYPVPDNHTIPEPPNKYLDAAQQSNNSWRRDRVSSFR